ncbi:MAG: twin-arginine translocase TatA/TatE family subunit [Candidatus Bathyarchaeia archaeon]|jgi:sec-independent protein translocase protein TatA
MAIVGFEAITVVAILVILFIWGPQKLPEMARSIGLAKREFEKATKEMTTLATAATTAPSTSAASTQQDPLIVAAKSLGITTEGKTKEELANEIAQRTTKK